MILHLGCCVLLLFSVAKIDACCGSQHPALQILDQGERYRGIFCSGNTAKLKFIFPEEMAALAWYVNGSEKPIDSQYRPKDLPGHSIQSSPEGDYTVVNNFKEEPYRANYSCAVYHISDNALSNYLEVIFQGTLFCTDTPYTVGWHSMGMFLPHIIMIRPWQLN